jgi:hypothetical protein
MTKRGPDHQKREAKRSLWDQDGQHIPKKYRNKGKGRNKDKFEIDEAFKEIADLPITLQDEAWADEIDLAFYCHDYGPCAKCLASQALEENEELLERLTPDQ